MLAPPSRPALRMVLLFAALYLVIGIVFATFSDAATTSAVYLMWRRLAWVVSGIGFAAHIAYEHFRLAHPPRTAALHVSSAAALGALGLALTANLHESMSAAPYRAAIVIALVAWPLLTLLPAFAVAIVGALVLNRWCPRSERR